MTRKDKLQIVIVGLVIAASFMAVLYLMCLKSYSDSYRDFPLSLRPTLLSTIGPVEIIFACFFVCCGLGISYGLWEKMNPRGKKRLADRLQRREQYLEDNAQEIAKGKQALSDGCWGCALMSPCVVPLVIVAIAIFIAALAFLGSLFHH